MTDSATESPAASARRAEYGMLAFLAVVSISAVFVTGWSIKELLRVENRIKDLPRR